jgi:DNA polymerase-3 subunit epsilon
LESDAEVVNIAVVAPDGRVVLDTLVKPCGPIPAAAIYGMTDEKVLGMEAQTMRRIIRQFWSLVRQEVKMVSLVAEPGAAGTL